MNITNKNIDGREALNFVTHASKFEDIKNSNNWETVEKISKGWSSDSKYLIKTKEGKLLLLRISDVEKYNTKKKEYEIIEKYSELGFPMSFPIDFGVCNNGKNIYVAYLG